jgi:hypothetical protein
MKIILAWAIVILFVLLGIVFFIGCTPSYDPAFLALKEQSETMSLKCTIWNEICAKTPTTEYCKTEHDKIVQDALRFITTAKGYKPSGPRGAINQKIVTLDMFIAVYNIGCTGDVVYGESCKDESDYIEKLRVDLQAEERKLK